MFGRAYPDFLTLFCLLIPILLQMQATDGTGTGHQSPLNEQSPADIVQTEEWKAKAERMVQEQLLGRDIHDKAVLKAMRNTPRHRFVPEGSRSLAYTDRPLPIGQGQTISQPYIVGLMTQLLELEGSEKVLEIGTGSGYQAAILSELSASVYTIEIKKSLARSAEERLSKMGYENVQVRWGDGYKGWPEKAPFDRIILTAAPERIPQKLVEQLSTGGRMVLPVGETLQKLKVLTKKQNGSLKTRTVTGVRFVPMIQGEGPDSTDR